MSPLKAVLDTSGRTVSTARNFFRDAFGPPVPSEPVVGPAIKKALSEFGAHTKSASQALAQDAVSGAKATGGAAKRIWSVISWPQKAIDRWVTKGYGPQAAAIEAPPIIPVEIPPVFARESALAAHAVPPIIQEAAPGLNGFVAKVAKREAGFVNAVTSEAATVSKQSHGKLGFAVGALALGAVVTGWLASRVTRDNSADKAR
jgi:hypothetical protein